MAVTCRDGGMERCNGEMPSHICHSQGVGWGWQSLMARWLMPAGEDTCITHPLRNLILMPPNSPSPMAHIYPVDKSAQELIQELPFPSCPPNISWTQRCCTSYTAMVEESGLSVQRAASQAPHQLLKQTPTFQCLHSKHWKHE